MTDQAELAKVIRGLEICSTAMGVVHCSECPYKPLGRLCKLAAMRDALALLKAQEPRVLELEEVNRLEQNEVVWLEDKGIEEIIPAIVVSHGHRYAQQSVCLMIVENPRLWIETFDYRERWRCWTSRPTDAQREATPWGD